MTALRANRYSSRIIGARVRGKPEHETEGPLETLIVERADGIVNVTMNRPEKKNALNDLMFRELLEVFHEVTDSDQDRVLVLTGAGANFSAGADLSSGGPDRHFLASMRF